MNKKRLVGLLAGSALLAGTATGVAVASIPDPSGSIHGCYSNLTGTVKVIDSSASCGLLQTPLNWNQTGPVGPQGPPGSSQPLSTVVYTHNVVESVGYQNYTLECPSGYYISSFFYTSEDGSGGSAVLGFQPSSPNTDDVSLGINTSGNVVVDTVCTYYGSVVAQ